MYQRSLGYLGDRLACVPHPSLLLASSVSVRARSREDMMAKRKAESVYRVVDVVGESATSWEEAGRRAVETAATSIRDLSFKYETSRLPGNANVHSAPYTSANTVGSA